MLTSFFVTTSLLGLCSGSYAPAVVDCPTDIPLVRAPVGISPREQKWVHGRKTIAAEAFASYLARLELEDFDLAAYRHRIFECPEKMMPTTGFANSGGGARSAYTGAGAMRAFDSSYGPAMQSKTGGLLQSMTYWAGLSGGSWPVSSYAFHNFAAMDDVVHTWNPEVNQGAFSNFTTYFEEIAPKFEAGYAISVMDVFARSFAYQYLPGADGDLEATWSSIASFSNFKNFSGPMPLLQTSSIEEGDTQTYGVYIPRPSNPMYEWTPFEFGSWHKGFTPTEYVGSMPGAHGGPGKCIKGLDRTSFVMGTSASAWNFWWLAARSNGTLGQFAKRDLDAPDYEPVRHQLNRRDSPLPLEALEGVNSAFNHTFGLSLPRGANALVPAAFSPNRNITLTDNSEVLQAIPFWSLIHERNLDFIIGWDDDSEQAPYKWNNGTSMYETSVLAKKAGLAFPTAPPPSTFLARNYTIEPTFFGCNTSHTTTGDSRSPIVLYMSNSPWSWYSNFTWGNSEMSQSYFDGVLNNSFNVVTQGNGAIDPEWPSCIACAAIDRSLERVGLERTDQCERCFARHCWDGTVDSPEPWAHKNVFDPAMVLEPSQSFAEWNKTYPVKG